MASKQLKVLTKNDVAKVCTAFTHGLATTSTSTSTIKLETWCVGLLSDPDECID
jgi:hypothetical protein